mgnify:FL=1
MWFHIDPSSGTPIYRQIVDQVRQAVAGGTLRPGDRLPSVRDLALELALNPNTVAKAYQELERSGVIETPRGKGSFVTGGDRGLPPRLRREKLELAAERLAAEAYHLGASDDEVVNALRRKLEEARRKREDV